MNDATTKLELMLRVRALEVSTSRHQALLKGKDLAVAAAASAEAEGQYGEAVLLEAAALARRNADPTDQAALLHSRACAGRTSDASGNLDACRDNEAEAASAVVQARRAMLRAETRHDTIAERVRLEASRQRRRAERRREEEHRLPGRMVEVTP